MRLYSYWRSSAAYRIRIALNLKGLSFETVPVNLVTGEQHAPDFVALSPGHAVPALELDDGSVLPQSMAILEWLEEEYPEPPLLPHGALPRAKVRAAALGIASDIHPVNNSRVLVKLKEMGHSQDDAVAWMHDWMTRGFTAFEAMIAPDGPFCFGDAPGLADICLVPQLYNARRWGLDLAPFARITQIDQTCLALPAFDTARPEAQPDAN